MFVSYLISNKSNLFILFFVIVSCNTDIQEQILEINISGFIKCLTEFSLTVPDLMDVRKYIKAGEYTQAAIQPLELVLRGYPVVKECISAFTEEPTLISLKNMYYN